MLLGFILITKIYYIIFAVENLKIDLPIKREFKYIKNSGCFDLNVINLNSSGYSVFFNFISLTNYIITGTDLERRRFVLIRKNDREIKSKKFGDNIKLILIRRIFLINFLTVLLKAYLFISQSISYFSNI